jgi:low affinity Fe/Cu permease
MFKSVSVFLLTLYLLIVVIVCGGVGIMLLLRHEWPLAVMFTALTIYMIYVFLLILRNPELVE